MDTSTISLWLQLCAIPGMGATRLAELATAYDKSGRLNEDLLLRLAEKLPKKPRQQIFNIVRQTNSFQHPQVETWLRWSEQPDHHILVLPDPGFPAMLRLLPDPPAVLFLRGNPELLWQPQLAIVGSRNPSPTGREHAYHFARALAGGGFTVTSGLALGIDGAAHEGALKQLGSTIAVLGSGLNVVYPASHRQLACRIAATGLVASEFFPDTPPKAANFPRRNRIISGLTLGTLVVEASIRSGSLITARLALEQGREVFAIPGSIQNPQARGCHHLIKQGAKLVETTDDIFNELPQLMQVYQQLQLPVAQTLSEAKNTLTPDEPKTSETPQNCKPPETRAETPATAPPPEARESATAMDPGARQVLDAVGFEATHTDQIVARTGLNAGDVQVQLMILELAGLVRTERGGVLRVR